MSLKSKSILKVLKYISIAALIMIQLGGFVIEKAFNSHKTSQITDKIYQISENGKKIDNNIKSLKNKRLNAEIDRNIYYIELAKIKTEIKNNNLAFKKILEQDKKNTIAHEKRETIYIFAILSVFIFYLIILFLDRKSGDTR